MTEENEKINLRLYLKPELEYEFVKHKLNNFMPNFEVEDFFYEASSASEIQIYIYVRAKPLYVKKIFGSKVKHSKKTGRWNRINNKFNIPNKLVDIIETVAIDNTPPGLRSLIGLKKYDFKKT